jgi:tRNA(Ile)-lysidine synthase
LRHSFAARGVLGTGLSRAVASVGRMRDREEGQIAAELAAHATIRPEGFALLSPGRIGSAAWRSLIQTIGGATYPPSPAQLAALEGPRLQNPHADSATLAGVRVMPAGRFGAGWLVVREEAAIADPVEVRPGTVWDNRFRMIAGHGLPDGATIGKLGDDAARVRGISDLPSAILRTLPAIRIGEKLAAVPPIGYTDGTTETRVTVMFNPPGPVAGSSFMPAD